jgi:hypothetical protein
MLYNQRFQPTLVPRAAEPRRLGHGGLMVVAASCSDCGAARLVALMLFLAGIAINLVLGCCQP